MGKRRTPEQLHKAYTLLANSAIYQYNGAMTCPEQRQFNIRQVSNGLYDTPSTHTGFISEEAHALLHDEEQDIKKSDLVEEHFYPRTTSAYKIFEMLDAGATKDELINFIKMVCQVHLVTKDENKRLRSFQKRGSGYDTWEEQYAAAKIKLIPYVPKKRKRKPKK
jgi:hypothetical protein